MWAALHHLLLGHGEVAAILRQIGGKTTRIGASLGLTPIYVARPGADNERAGKLYDAYVNGVVLDPLLLGTYPENLAEHFKGALPDIRPGDLDRIAIPLDFVGVNYFTCRRVRAQPGAGPLPITETPPDGALTMNGWEINPEGLGHMVRRYIKQAGIDKPGACHLFRHSVATLMLENGADVRYIQEMLGHKHLQSTQIYTKVSISKLKEIHDRTHPGKNRPTKTIPPE